MLAAMGVLGLRRRRVGAAARGRGGASGVGKSQDACGGKLSMEAWARGRGGGRGSDGRRQRRAPSRWMKSADQFVEEEVAGADGGENREGSCNVSRQSYPACVGGGGGADEEDAAGAEEGELQISDGDGAEAERGRSRSRKMRKKKE